MKTVFLRALEADDKAASLRAAIANCEAPRGGQRFEVDAASFAAVPRSPFAYWVSDRLRRTFADLQPLEAQGRKARQGGVNGDDFRWLRLWLEVTTTEPSATCVPIAKGGKYSPFYADLPLRARWDPAKGTFCAFTGLPHRPSLRPASFHFYFRPGLTWPRRTQGGLSLRAMPAGCIFADKGPAAFVEHDDHGALLALLATVNGTAFRALVDLQMAFGSYEVGVIQRTPVPPLTPEHESALAALARRAWSLVRSLDTRTESSHAFVLPALLQVTGDTLDARVGAWSDRLRAVGVELAEIQAEIDTRCFDLYGFCDADRRAIIDGFGGTADEAGEHGEGDAESDDEGDDLGSADARGLVAELVSWAVGVAFGRFDVRLATGARALPLEPGPFDPLPVCSPAMLTGDEGLPLAAAPSGYPLASPAHGVLVDDPGDGRDFATAVQTVFREVFGASADELWQEAEALLDPKDHHMRAWLGSGFFEHHLKRHSKSRRKAPILWQLATPSGRYGVWLYAHRLSRDSFFQLQNDVLAPKLAHEERRLTSLVQSAGGSPSASERKPIAEQEAFCEELRMLLDGVKQVAPLWNPMLDDGVVLTMAPLWRLVPQHKPWQKELKGKWDELAHGKYDWSHVAMHLWPERVVPRCATDRSLAIAHGLDDVLWVEGEDGKWQPRAAPTRPVDDLVSERISPAVQTALQSLLEERVAVSANRRRATAR